jgi:hypothetical protein
MLERYDLTARPRQCFDECPNDPGVPSPREEVLELLGKLVKLPLQNLRLCVTSRYELDMQAVLEPLSFFLYRYMTKLDKNKISQLHLGDRTYRPKYAWMESGGQRIGYQDALGMSERNVRVLLVRSAPLLTSSIM